MTEHSTQRWQSRPVGSFAVRLGVFVVPIACSISVSVTTVHLLPREPGAANLVMRLGVALVVSTIAFHLTDRLARRFMPLATMLGLSLAFPNEAPSRMRLARSAGSTRDLARIVERAGARAREGEADRGMAAAEILALVSAVEAHDRGTRGHSERVRVYTDMISEQLHLPKGDRDRLRWAALLHDVGKLFVPREVLTKASAPDADEWALLHRHPDDGAMLTVTVKAWLGEWAGAISQHHERWDGTGYPRGLAGEGISLAARIVSVADAYETMTARRPYSKPLRAAQARAELVRCSGTQFDPAIVRAFLQVGVARVRRVGGPLSWLAQTPLIRGVEQAAASGAAAVGGTALVLGMVPIVPQPAEPPRARPGISSPAAERRDQRVGVVVPSTGPLRETVAPVPQPAPSSRSPEPSPDPSPVLTPPVEGPTRTPSPSPDQTPGPLPNAIPSREG